MIPNLSSFVLVLEDFFLVSFDNLEFSLWSMML